jgi:hypothetical protein
MPAAAGATAQATVCFDNQLRKPSCCIIPGKVAIIQSNMAG